jgi:hypothetical protein
MTMALSVLLTGRAVSSPDHVTRPSILLIYTGRVPERLEYYAILQETKWCARRRPRPS